MYRVGFSMRATIQDGYFILDRGLESGYAHGEADLPLRWDVGLRKFSAGFMLLLLIYSFKFSSTF